MVDVVFNQSGNVCGIVGEVVYATDFWFEKNGQVQYITGDSAIVVYDYSAPEMLFAELVVKNVSYADFLLLQTWIREKALYRLNTFTITCNPNTYINLGLGRGVNITNAHYNKSDTEGIFKITPPGIYEIKFPFVRTV